MPRTRSRSLGSACAATPSGFIRKDASTGAKGSRGVNSSRRRAGRCWVTICAPGEVSEWLKEHAWKACVPKRYRGFAPSAVCGATQERPQKRDKRRRRAVANPSLSETAAAAVVRFRAPGELSKWLKEHAWKACVPKRYRGFESLPLRQTSLVSVSLTLEVADR